MAKIVTISGTDYEFDSLSDTAQKLVANVAAADTRLEQLRSDLSMIQVARDVSAKALVDALPASADNSAAASAPKTPVH